MTGTGIITIKIDQREFTQALRQIVAVFKDEPSKVINQSMQNVLEKAAEFSPKAKEADIRKLTIPTGGPDGSEAGYIVNARRQFRGKPRLRGAELDAAVNRMIAAKIRAIGTEQSGWNRSIRGFASVTGAAPKLASVKRVSNKGSFSTAKPSWNPVATAEYAVNYQKLNTTQGREWEGLDPRLIDAATDAFEFETQRLESRLVGQIQPLLNKHLVKARVAGFFGIVN